MKKVKEVFEELTITSGRLDKENIIKENKDNELFVNTIQFLLDPYIVTGISKKKMSKKLNLNLDAYEAKNINDLMDYISKNNMQVI